MHTFDGKFDASGNYTFAGIDLPVILREDLERFISAVESKWKDKNYTNLRLVTQFDRSNPVHGSFIMQVKLPSKESRRSWLNFRLFDTVKWFSLFTISDNGRVSAVKMKPKHKPEYVKPVELLYEVWSDFQAQI